MKHAQWIIAAAVLLSGTGYAQSQRTGITGGVNISTFNGMNGVNTKNGLIIGGFTECNLVAGFAIQPEVRFSMKGATQTLNSLTTPPFGTETTDWTLSYIEIPVLLRFKVVSTPILPVGIDLYAGPDFAFNLLSRMKTDNGSVTSTTDESDNTHPFDFNISVGAGPTIDLGLMELGVEARYTFGTGSMFKNGAFGDARNGVWSIMASAAF